MNTRKSIAIAAAMLITAAGLAGIANYSNAAADAARHASDASAPSISTLPAITTLPTINVTPTPEQLRELRKEATRGGSASAHSSDARMPYYSFAAGEAGA